MTLDAGETKTVPIVLEVDEDAEGDKDFTIKAVYDDQVTEIASFEDDLGADSLDVVELVMGLEEEFDIEIPDEDAEKIKTVEQAVSYIDEKNA